MQRWQSTPRFRVIILPSAPERTTAGLLVSPASIFAAIVFIRSTMEVWARSRPFPPSSGFGFTFALSDAPLPPFRCRFFSAMTRMRSETDIVDTLEVVDTSDATEETLSRRLVSAAATSAAWTPSCKLAVSVLGLLVEDFGVAGAFGVLEVLEPASS